MSLLFVYSFHSFLGSPNHTVGCPLVCINSFSRQQEGMAQGLFAGDRFLGIALGVSAREYL